MPQGLEKLQHIVVLMMENRSFDHMLGGLKKKFPRINGLNGDELNPDANGNIVKVQPKRPIKANSTTIRTTIFPALTCRSLAAPRQDLAVSPTCRGSSKAMRPKAPVWTGLMPS